MGLTHAFAKAAYQRVLAQRAFLHPKELVTLNVDKTLGDIKRCWGGE